MVSNTSELLPEPETPVNTVSRRFGSSTLTSLRLFSRAPSTRITSWLSAACSAGDCASVLVAVTPFVVVSMTVTLAAARERRFSGTDRSGHLFDDARRYPVHRPCRLAPIDAGRHADQFGEPSAERAQRRAADLETD